MQEFNQGYAIIAAETYATFPNDKELRVVLGKMETSHYERLAVHYSGRR